MRPPDAGKRLAVFSMLLSMLLATSWMGALACAPGSSPGPTSSRAPSEELRSQAKPTSPPTLSDVESETLAGINAHRTSIGLRPLQHDAVLADIARAHSRAMAGGRTPLGHERLSSRATMVREYMPSRRVGENVSKSSRVLNQVANAAVRGWLASPPHLRNVNGTFSTSGIGAVRNAQGVTFMTQIFAGN
jgi:uncharacterized protein YkwD